MLLAGIQAANLETETAGSILTVGVDIIEAAWNNQPVHHPTTPSPGCSGSRVRCSTRSRRTDAWKAAIVASSAAQRKPIAPVLVCVDSFDGGTVIPVAWQTGYVDAVKGFGGAVEVRDYPHDDHFAAAELCP